MAFNLPNRGPVTFPLETSPQILPPFQSSLCTALRDQVARDPLLDALVLTDLDRRGQRATGKTRLFFSGHSRAFIHGPDTLIPMTELAARLLEEEERLVGASRIQFRKMVQSELSLVADASGQLGPDQLRGASVYATYTTDKDRHITVVGTPVHEPVEGGMWHGRFLAARSLFGAQSTLYIGEDEITVAYDTGTPLSMTLAEKASPGFHLATFLDSALQGAGNILRGLIKSQYMLAAGCQNMTWQNVSLLEPGGKFTLTLQDPFRKTPHFSFAVFQTTLQNPDGRELGAATVEVAFPNTFHDERAFIWKETTHPFFKY